MLFVPRSGMGFLSVSTALPGCRRSSILSSVFDGLQQVGMKATDVRFVTGRAVSGAARGNESYGRNWPDPERLAVSPLSPLLKHGRRCCAQAMLNSI